MQNNQNIVTTIDGFGLVEVESDLAQFSLNVKSKHDSLERAKDQVQEKLTNVVNFLKGFTQDSKLEKEITTSVSNYKLEHRENGERIPAGFQCIGVVDFTIVVDDSLDTLYQACLKFDSNMSRPIFSVKNREQYVEQALQKAANNVKDKLNKECQLMDVSRDMLKAQNWTFGYEGVLPSVNTFNSYGNSTNYSFPIGATGATGPQGSIGYMGVTSMKLGSIYQEPLDVKKLEPDTAIFRIAARVNYIWA